MSIIPTMQQYKCTTVDMPIDEVKSEFYAIDNTTCLHWKCPITQTEVNKATVISWFCLDEAVKYFPPKPLTRSILCLKGLKIPEGQFSSAFASNPSSLLLLSFVLYVRLSKKGMWTLLSLFMIYDSPLSPSCLLLCHHP